MAARTVALPFILFFIFLPLSSCRLPAEVKPVFSTHEEILIFNANGNLLRRSPPFRGVPRDIEFLPDGNALIAVDGCGLAILNPQNGSLSKFFGPQNLQSAKYIAGKTLLGLKPIYLTLWYFEEVVRLLDAQGQTIGTIAVPKGSNDVDCLDNGNLLLTEGAANRIREIKPTGETVWTSAIPLKNPYSAIHTARDTFLIADFDNHRVLEINRNNQVVFTLGGLNHPRRMQILADNNILVADSDMRRVVAIRPPDQVTPVVAQINRPTCLAYDAPQSILLVGIEAFFPPSPEEKISDTSTARLHSFLIWLGTAIPVLLIYGLLRGFRGSASERIPGRVSKWSNAVTRYSTPLLISAILSSIFAAWSFAVARFLFGWILSGLAITAAFLSRFQSATDPAGEVDNDEENGSRTIEPETGVIRSPLCILIGVLIFWFVLIWTQSWTNDGWPVILWLIGPWIALFGFVKRSRETFQPSDAVWLVLIFGVAAFFRLYRLDEIPYGLWLDETFSAWKALIGYETNNLAPFQTTPLVRPNEFEIVNLYLLLFALWMKYIAASFWVVKSTSLIPAFGIVLAVYCVGKWGFGRWAARCGALLFAMNAWQVTFARWGWLQQLYVCLALSALAFYLRSYKWKCPRSAALSGLFLGYGLFTYVPILITIATLLLLFSISFLEPDRRLRLKQLAISAYLVILVFGPLWAYYLENPGIFTTRAAVVGITQDLIQAKSIQPVIDNLWKYALMFHRPGENNPRHNIPFQPILDPITGGLFFVGIGLAVLRFYRPGERALLLTFLLAMMGGVFSAAIEAPNSFRVGLAGPILCLLSALPLAGLARARERRLKSGGNTIRINLFLFLVYAGIAGFSYSRYFVQYPSSNTWDATMGAKQHLIYTQLTPDDLGIDHLFVHPEFTTTTFNLYTYFLEVEKVGPRKAILLHPRYAVLDLKEQVPALRTGANLFVMPLGYEEKMKQLFPGITLSVLRNPNGEPQAVLGKILTPSS